MPGDHHAFATDTDILYAYGPLRGTKENALAVLTRTDNGWRCRSYNKDRLNHDYVSYESIEQIRTWLEYDFRIGYMLTESITEDTVEEIIDWDPALLRSPNPDLSLDEAVMQAVEHLSHV